jgi:hypothetical protein
MTRIFHYPSLHRDKLRTYLYLLLYPAMVIVVVMWVNPKVQFGLLLAMVAPMIGIVIIIASRRTRTAIAEVNADEENVEVKYVRGTSTHTVKGPRTDFEFLVRRGGSWRSVMFKVEVKFRGKVIAVQQQLGAKKKEWIYNMANQLADAGLNVKVAQALNARKTWGQAKLS